MVESFRPAYTGVKDSVPEKQNNSKENKIPPLHSQLCVSCTQDGRLGDCSDPVPGSWETWLFILMLELQDPGTRCFYCGLH